MNLLQLLNKGINDGGMTLRQVNGKVEMVNHADGYQVATTNRTYDLVDYKYPIERALNELTVMLDHAQVNHGEVGIYINQNKQLVIEPCYHMHNIELAIEMGIVNNQEAIFDWVNLKNIYLTKPDVNKMTTAELNDYLHDVIVELVKEKMGLK